MNKLSKKMLAAVMAVMIPVAGLGSAAIAISSVDTSAVAEAAIVGSSGVNVQGVIDYMSSYKNQKLGSKYGASWCAYFLSDALMANGVNLGSRIGTVGKLTKKLVDENAGTLYIPPQGQGNAVYKYINVSKYTNVSEDFEIKVGDILLYEWSNRDVNTGVASNGHDYADADHIEVATRNAVLKNVSNVTSIGGNTGGNGWQNNIVNERAIGKNNLVAIFRFGNVNNSSSSSSNNSSSSGLSIADIDNFRSAWVAHPYYVRTPYTLSQNMSSTGRAAILGIQKMLSYLGYSIDIDGYYGPASESTVRSFQSSKGLSVDGVVGNDTFNALYNACKNKINATANANKPDPSKAVFKPNMTSTTAKVGDKITVSASISGYTPTTVRFEASDGITFDSGLYNNVENTMNCVFNVSSSGNKTIKFTFTDENGKVYKAFDVNVNVEEQIKTVGSKVTNSANGHQYQLIYSTKDYNQTALWAKSQGGYLASIKDKSENDFIFNLCKQNGQYSVYFGLVKNGNSWKWESGESFSYSNWHVGEPSGGTEKYGMYYSGFGDSSWNDGDAGKGAYYVVEWGSTAPVNDPTKAVVTPSVSNVTMKPGETKDVTIQITGYKETSVGTTPATGVRFDTASYNHGSGQATCRITVDKNATAGNKTVTFYYYDENLKSYKGCDITVTVEAVQQPVIQPPATQQPVAQPTTQPVITNQTTQTTPTVTPNNQDSTNTNTTPSQNSSSVTITYADTTTFLSNWRNHPYSVSVSNTSGNSRETGVKTITDIQKMLNFLGYSTPIDGTYSTSTESAVKSFQKDKGLTSDGVVSSLTFNALILACRNKV